MKRSKDSTAAKLRFMVGVAALFCVVSAGSLAFLAVVPAKIMGWRPVTVASGSMQPHIDAGDVVVADPHHGRIGKGTIVVFRDPGGDRLVTHRILGRNRDGSYLTAGDANRAHDSTPLAPSRIVGVGRLLVPLAGLPGLWVRNGDYGRVIALAAGLLLAMWLARYGLLGRYDPWADDTTRATGTRRSARRRQRRRLVARSTAALLVTLALVAGTVKVTEGSFSSLTSNGPNSFAAAASFFTCTASRPTPVFLTGMEHGTSTTTAGLWDNASSPAPVVDSTVKRNGSYSLKIPKTSGTFNFVLKNLSGSVVVERFAVRLESLPAASVTQFAEVQVNSGSQLDIGYDAPTQKLQLSWPLAGGTSALSASTVQAGTWYLIDVKFNVGANPRTADWRVNGVPQAQASFPAAGSTAFDVGFGSGHSSEVFTAYIDDVFVSTTSADYPIGDGKALALRPSTMGTSVGATNFQHDDGSAIGSSTYLRLDDNPMNSTTDYVKQVTSSGTSYVELGFDDTAETCINGVEGVLAYHAATGLANNGQTQVLDGTTATTVYSGNMGTIPLAYKRSVVQPAASPWSQTALNGVTARIGFSTDVSPNPFWDALTLEYDVAF